MRAAVRAIALKAAKGDVKAYSALAAKRDAIEDRRRAHQDETLQAVLEYMDEATLELMRRKQEGVSGPEIIPHPADIDIDPKTGSIVFHGPLTADQKMAQDLMVSTWPAIEQEFRNSPLFEAKDPSFLRMYAKRKMHFDTVSSPGGEAGIQGQFMGHGYAARANGLSSKGSLADSNQGKSFFCEHAIRLLL